MALKFDVHSETEITGPFAKDGRKKDVVISGPGNSVLIGERSDISGLKLEMLGNGNKLVIGQNCRLRGHVLIKGNGVSVTIGDHTTFVGAYLLASDGCGIKIGRWCMLSRDIEIRVSDAHSVIDVTTGERVNLPAPISIGDHVWIGVGALISKGVTIGADNIVGAASFVNRSFPESQCVIAGTPAKIVKTGVTWHRSQRKIFSNAEMDHWRSDSDPRAF